MANLPPTYAEFVLRFPEFSGISEASVQAQLDASVRLLDPDAWQDNYWDGVCYDSAHTLTIFALSSAGGETGGIQAGVGQVTSSSAAGMSTSFSQMNVNSKSASDFWYSKTSYGQMFLKLRTVTIPMGVMAV
jgi:hypothetical protein